MSNDLLMYAVYDHPKDFPTEFIVREWHCLPGRAIPGDLFARGPTLDAVRDQLPAGLTCLNRMPGDDPVIVETWL